MLANRLLFRITLMSVLAEIYSILKSLLGIVIFKCRELLYCKTKWVVRSFKP